MSKVMVVLELGTHGLAQVLHPGSAIALSEALYNAAEQAEKEQRVVYVSPLKEGIQEEIVDKSLPDAPPEPAGVADKFSPAVQEALVYGDHDMVSRAPDVIQILGGALGAASLNEETVPKVLQAIRLLQEVVRG